MLAKKGVGMTALGRLTGYGLIGIFEGGREFRGGELTSGGWELTSGGWELTPMNLSPILSILIYPIY